jgi:prolyl-tRNA synthetase
MFIPESLLQKEKDHVEGFAPECAIVTIGGNNKLSERLIVRPTSETLFCDHFKNIIQSYRDLPKLYNQWVNVVRWEKTTRPFLRTSEFLWQEGHTMHETEAEAREETLQMLKVYEEFYLNCLAIPAITGQKTEKEKFAGAVETYTIEPMMHNGVALQGGTTHYFGQGFAKAFDITFTGRDNTVNYPHQTSWGVSTRMIGAIIMAHGDDNGLILPPAIAPIQVVIIPVAQHKEGVLEKANELKARLAAKGIRVKLDDSDQSTGWKYSQYEMKGVPVRLEVGPRDIESGNCVLVSRVSREKNFVSMDNLEAEVERMLQFVHDELVSRAEKNLAEQMMARKNIEFIGETVIEEFEGEENLQSLTLRNVTTGAVQYLSVAALFEAIGQLPQNTAFADLVDLDEDGYFLTDNECRTSCPGIFAAGDACRKSVRQLTTAVADGTVAALSAVEYLR